MATDRMIEVVLTMFGATFNKNAEWQAQIFPIWKHGLEQVKDIHLHKAIMSVCSKKWKYPPTLGHVIEEINDVVRVLGGTVETQSYKFCDACVLREGVREVSAHFLVLATQKHRIYNVVTRCTCEGASMKYPKMGDWNSLEVKMNRDARITVTNFIVSDARQPILTMKQRAPHHYERMKRVQKERALEGKPNPYMEVAKTMIDGRFVPEETQYRHKPTQTFDTPPTKQYTTTTQTDIDPDDCIW